MYKTKKQTKNIRNKALHLCQQTITAIENDKLTVTNICRKCCRIALMLQQSKAASYFEKQLLGFPLKTNNKALGEFNRWWVYPITYDYPSLKSVYPDDRILDPLEVVELKARRKSDSSEMKMISIVKQKCHRWLTKTSLTLQTQDVPAKFYEEINRKLTAILSTVDPSIIEVLASISTNLSSKNQQDVSSAVLSCRTILQKLADILYPPQKQKVVDRHKTGKEEYKNRLIQFVKERMKSTSLRKNLKSNLNYIDLLFDCYDKRISITYDLTHKGKKGILKDDAKRIVMYVYLLIWDIVALLDEKYIKEISLSKQRTHHT